VSLPPLDVPELLKRHGLRPNKRLGQNFLIDPVALGRIVQIAEIDPQDAVLEIGPGLGGLTRLLAERARSVVAVEIDANLIGPLREVVAGMENVKIVQGDILGLDPAELIEADPEQAGPGYLVVANIPYYITSALIRHLLEARVQPTRMVLTVQREVADRLTAEPGDMSLLALSVQVYGQPEIKARIPAGAFFPPPNVDSAVVRIDLYPEPRIPAQDLDFFFRLAKAGFSQKRKTLRNTLAGGMRWSKEAAGEALESAGIDPMRRAETLSLDEWARLVEVVRASPLE